MCTRYSIVENESDIMLLLPSLCFPASNSSNPLISILDIVHVKFHKVVNIGKSLGPITSSVEFLPSPTFDVILSAAIMPNTVQSRSFEPHNT